MSQRWSFRSWPIMFSFFGVLCDIKIDWIANWAAAKREKNKKICFLAKKSTRKNSRFEQPEQKRTSSVKQKTTTIYFFQFYIFLAKKQKLKNWKTLKMTNMKLASETQCTVVVAGDSRIGKTALIQRFVNKTFQQVRIYFNY